MLSLSRRTVVGGALVGAVAIAVPVAIAAEGGGGTPANKAVAAGSKTVKFSPGTNVTLMSASLKTSKPTDLLIGVSLECSIITDVVIEGSSTPGTTQFGFAGGAVRVWVELDGQPVPIQDVSTPPQDPAASGKGNESDKVTFCDRVHERTVRDAESPQNGVDFSRDYQETKSANAFNWVRLNAGSGDHVLTVKADLKMQSDPNSTASAFVGNRTLVVEPTKLANAAVISDNGTSNSGR